MTCPHCNEPLTKDQVLALSRALSAAYGAQGGKVRSPAKIKAAQRNGRKNIRTTMTKLRLQRIDGGAL